MQSLIISGKTFRQTKTFFLCFLIFISLCFTGCKKNSSNAEFAVKLALIDGCIAQNEIDDAFDYLKSAQKHAYSVSQRLSIVKRYRKLGAAEQAEKFLVASIKKLPDSVELVAVYVQTLLDKGDLETASQYASQLKDTWFDSLYAELCMRQVTSPSLYYESTFSDMYQSAWKTTGDMRWLRNSALLLASQGNLKDAARLHPGVYDADEEPFFWVLLDYDAENFNRAIEGARFIIDNVPESREAASLICSDAWLQTGEMERANEYWLSFINEEKSAGEKAPALIYKNAAHYAVVNGNPQNACNLLTSGTAMYPEYVPMLVEYVNYAIAGDAEQKAYEAENTAFMTANLKTLAMEAHDAIPRLSLEDAILKLEDSLSQNYSPELLVEYTRVRWKMQNLSEERCLSELWTLLEQTRLDDHYEPYMIRWAVTWLSAHHNGAAAGALFEEYLISMYGYGSPDAYVAEMEDWECELAAWFALKDKNYDLARLLYENRLKERETRPDTGVLMNCAAIYTYDHNYVKALEVYSALAPEIEDPLILSEVQYRIGAIQYELHEKRNALLSLTYSIKLNPDNHRARLLLKQIE